MSPGVTLPVKKWHGCYDDSWQDLIVPESFSHPAKFSRGLIERIVRHGLEKGYWKAGETIGDPFGGVALGGIVCGYHGLNWHGVELEEKFVKLGCQNLDLHRKKIKRLGYDVTLELHQGDSRQFATLVDGICTSPPFVDSMSDKPSSQVLAGSGGRMGASCKGDNYGTTPGQIGRLPAGSVDGVVTSPPYAGSIQGEHGETETAEESRAKRRTEGGSLGQSQRHGGYGSSQGNIGNLRSGSVDGICTSPPWEKSLESGGGIDVDKLYDGMVEKWGRSGTAADRKKQTELMARRVQGREYGTNSPGQIGNSTGETYWQAMAQVYGQCLKCLKPGGVMCVVLKDYVSNGKRVPLADDTLKLLVSLGFEPIERVRAMLIKEWTEPHLFEGQVTKRKERKSFFRRLAEARGSPRIDHEDVLIVRAE